jgi:PAS domain S-box-containing protein
MTDMRIPSGLLESLHGVVLALDGKGRVVACSPACVEILGGPTRPLRGRPLWELLHAPEEASRVRGLFARPRLEDFPFRVDAAWRSPDLEGPWLGLVLGVLEAEEDRPLLLVGTGLYLTGARDAEREQALAQRQGWQRRMEAVLRQLPTGVVIRDASGRLIDYNEQAELLLGRRLTALLTEDNPMLPAVHRMDGGAFPAQDVPLLRALRGEPTRNERVRYSRPDGRELVLELSAEPIRDATGVIQAGVLVFSDRTAQVAAEDALREREQSLRELNLLTSAQGLDFDTRLRELLALGCRRFHRAGGVIETAAGSTLEVLARHGTLEDADPEGPPPLEALLRVNGRPYGMLGFHGARPPWRPVSSADLDLLELMAQWVGAELERERVRRREALLAEAGAAFSSSLDERETLLGVARLFTRDFADYCLIDLVEGGNHPVALTAQARDPANAALAQALLEYEHAHGRHQLLRQVLQTGQSLLMPFLDAAGLAALADGPEHLGLMRRLRPRSAMVLPLAARGRTLGVVVLVRSGPGTAYEEGDQRLAEALSHRAALAMDNARLYRVAQDAVRARDDVLQTIAHDLRNPLSAILLSAQFLLSDALGQAGGPRTTESMQDILQAANRMDRLIQDLLDVTRIEVGALGLRRERVRVDSLLQEAVNEAEGLAATRGLRLECRPPEPDLPPVDADPVRVQQVLSNLLGNAIKFTPPGGRVLLTAQREGGMVRFSVSDTGPGIPAEAQARLFDRFFQAHGRDRMGLGLGLAIARGLVEAHGGAIQVHSTPGQGATFWFTLPVAAYS